jgi:hypothetical protein
LAGEGKTGRLTDQVVGIADVGRVVPLAHGHVDAGPFFDWL